MKEALLFVAFVLLLSSMGQTLAYRTVPQFEVAAPTVCNGTDCRPCESVGDEMRRALLAQLQAEQERSCAARELLWALEREHDFVTGEPHVVGCENMDCLHCKIRALTDTTTCTHQERSERYRVALVRLSQWDMLSGSGDQVHDAPAIRALISSVLDQKKAVD